MSLADLTAMLCSRDAYAMWPLNDKKWILPLNLENNVAYTVAELDLNPPSSHRPGLLSYLPASNVDGPPTAVALYKLARPDAFACDGYQKTH
jgi:hypothetical protein